MTAGPLVVLRADASTRIGTGHVVRCTTLAEELIRRGWQALLATRELPEAMRRPLESAGIEVLPLAGDAPLEDEPARIAERLPARSGTSPVVVVTDHYGVDTSWHRRAAWATAIAAIDDQAERAQEVHLLLNQNLGATPARYAGLVPPDANLLLGPLYALVRPEFARAPGASSARVGLRAGVPRVLVMLGGSDEPDVTRRAASAAAELGYAADIVVGPAYRNTASLREWASGRSGITLHVNSSRVAGLMEAADVCVGAAGSASWERCALGLPAILVTLAQNQVEVATLLASAGAAVSLGWHEDVTDMTLAAAIRDLVEDSARLRSMSEAAATITDGRGTIRVADAFEEVAGIRPPTPREDES